RARSPYRAVLLRLVEERAALEHAGALLGGDLDIARGEQEDLVGDALHAAVERVGQSAGEVDEPLGELLVGALEVENDRHTLLEPVGDLLRVVEAAREDEVDANGAGPRNALDAAQPPRLRRRTEDARPGVRRRLGIGPVVELLPPAAAMRQAADVRPLGVGPLELLVGDVAVFVPVLLFGDAEVHEGAVPDVGKGHGCGDVTPATGLIPPGRGSLPRPRRRRSPGSFPSRARRARAPRRAREGGG